MKKFTKPELSIRFFKMLPLLMLLCAGSSNAQTWSTPGAYSVVVPGGSTTMVVTVTGAGGGSSGGIGGNGGTVSATYNVTPGTTYYIYVGAVGAGGGGAGGSSFGGGEDGGYGGAAGPGTGGGGGAASDIRTTSGVLSSRIVIGGGGGGGGNACVNSNGGSAGYPSGSAGGAGGGGCSCTGGGGGGTQTTGGAAAGCGGATAGTLGAGGNAASISQCGGGGGLYGGGGSYEGGGGGGSSYASPTGLVGTATYSSTNTGNGSVTICFAASAITGPTSVCPGSTIALSDATPGGTWTSSNTSAATVSSTGVVYGIAGGTTTINYNVGSCPASLVVTVGGLPAITGPTAVCTGSTITLSDATAGGTWTSDNTSVATITSGGVVSGVSSGTANISYTSGGCSTGIAITVGVLPAITGVTNVCPASTTHLSDTSPGGVWSSSNSAVATIVASGTVTGGTAGTATISYTVGGCSTTVTVTVSPLPPITGGNSVCAGSTLSLSDATTGGVWTSTNTTFATVSATGVVTGVAVGSANIIYTLGSCSVNIAITVGNAIAAITGTGTFCVTSSTTLSDATPGGVWSSSNTTVVTVSGTVVVHGVSAGAALISYSAGGCSVTFPITVDPNSGGTITGKDSVCIGSVHAVTLSDAAGGGTWTSSNTSRATVDPATGVVTGVSSGTFTITYAVTNTCGTFTVTYAMYVRTAAQCASGIFSAAESQLSELEVFPNPNGGTFAIDLPSDIDEEVHVLITNIVGEKVREFTMATNKSENIKLDPAPGMYLVSAVTSHGRYVAKIIIRQQ